MSINWIDFNKTGSGKIQAIAVRESDLAPIVNVTVHVGGETAPLQLSQSELKRFIAELNKFVTD